MTREKLHELLKLVSLSDHAVGRFNERIREADRDEVLRVLATAKATHLRRLAKGTKRTVMVRTPECVFVGNRGSIVTVLSIEMYLS